MAKMYYAKDCDINYLNGKKIAIIGYGSQGHAHALNLKDSGCDVCVGLRAGSKNWSVAEKDGLKVMTVPEAAKWGDIVMMLINDEVQADVYKRDIAPNLEDGNALAFAHGFNIRYQQIVPPKGVDVFMAAPKGPGHTVRSTYVAGKGVPCLVAVEQNATGDAMKIALAYIAGIGGARAGIMETTFHDETETDLFGEQAVLCGGVVDLMKCGFETLVEAGYAFAIMPDLPPARIPGLRYIPIPAFSIISFGAVYRKDSRNATLRLFLSSLGSLMQSAFSQAPQV